MASARPTRVFLVRHGATAANRAVPYTLQGSGSDLPLDELGREQARRAGAALADAGVRLDAVYSSPLLRAVGTGALVGAPFGLEPVIVPELTEGNVGRWEGLTWAQAQAQDPEHHARFHAHPGTVPYPDGESFQQVADRVGPAIARLARAHPGGNIAVVGHNIVNRAYLAAVLGLPMDLARTLRQSNGGLSLVEFEPDGTGPGRVEILNSLLHLEGLPKLA